jgi:hypothetical protein
MIQKFKSLLKNLKKMKIYKVILEKEGILKQQ